MKNILLLVLIFSSLQIYSQEKQTQTNNFTIVTFNVENLFDTINNPNKNDEDFLPEGKKKWNSYKYNKKLSDLATTISSINTNELPEIVGLCEIENKKVIEDLIAQPSLKNGKYSIVHEESPDERGIDNALIYKSSKFKYISHRAITINLSDKKDKTRDILYVKGVADKTDTLHIFVNHWSSRSGGMEASEIKRVYAALTLRREVDSIFRTNRNAKIVVMGDLNDEPTNKSVFTILQSNNKRKNQEPLELYNLMYDLHNNGNVGSYNYKGTWNIIDNLIVSQDFFSSNPGFKLKYDSGKIFSTDSLKDQSKKGFDGFSDHYPIYIVLTKQ